MISSRGNKTAFPSWLFMVHFYNKYFALSFLDIGMIDITIINMQKKGMILNLHYENRKVFFKYPFLPFLM